MASAKQWVKVIIGGISAIALFVFGLLAGRKRDDGSATADRIDDNIDRVRNRQSEITGIIDNGSEQLERSQAGIGRAESELSESSTVIDHSAARIRRAKDLLAELQRRAEKENNPDGAA